MEPDTLSKIANLPWNLQTVLASGYIAYLTAYVGLRQNHKTADLVFNSLAFGMVAALSIWMTPALNQPAKMAVAFASTVVAGMVWRAKLRETVRQFFRWSGYSWSDDTNSALEHLLEYSKTPPWQLSVETDDGTFCYSTDLSRTGDFAFGPYVLGTNGDVLMYVDAREDAKGNRTEHDWMSDPEKGDLVTYIPANRIRSIGIRFPWPTSAAVGAEGSAREAARADG